MGKLSNTFGCVTGVRDGVGRGEGHWNFDFYHVEPASLCMVDAAGKLVVDFVIRWVLRDGFDSSACTRTISGAPWPTCLHVSRL